MAKKRMMTKKEVLDLIKIRCADNEAIMEYCNLELELLEKKANGSKKVNVENEKLATMVLNELAKISSPITVNELIEKSQTIKDYVLENGNHISNQKLTAILYKLVDSKDVIQVKDKKKSYFSINQ